MTVPATPRRAGPFFGNNATTAFGFSFKVLDAADVRVVVLDTATGVETDAVLNVDYSVALNPDQESNPGGTVTFFVAPPVGITVALAGNTTYGQPVDLPDGGQYRAQQVEDALDRLSFQVQQLAEEVLRTLRMAITADSASTTLPAPVPLSVIGWNLLGDALRNFTPSELGVNVSYAAWRTQLFNGTGAQTSFVLTDDAGSVSNIDLRVNNVPQTPGVNFSYDQATRTITFVTGAPPAGTSNVVARYGQALPQGTFDLGDGTVTGPKLANNAVTASKIADREVSFQKLQEIATARLLGRTTAGAGSVEELLVGAGLLLAAGTLSNPSAQGLLSSALTTGTLTAAEAGALVLAASNITVPANVFSARQSVTIYNNTAGSITITQGGSLTLRQVGTANTGNRQLAARGLVTIIFVSATEAIISGGGLT